jgi:hypothetical protein
MNRQDSPITRQSEAGAAAETGRDRIMLPVRHLLLFAALLVPFAILVYRFWFVTDDAYISFRYSRYLAGGHGLRFNLGEHVPVEGYSNFLWVVLGALVELLGLSIDLWLPIISSICGGALLYLVYDRLWRRFEVHPALTFSATLTLACYPPYALWSSSGLATMPLALFVFLALDRLALVRNGVAPLSGAVCALLLSLIRFEGVLWVGVIAIVSFVSRWLAGQRKLRPWLTFAACFLIPYSVYYAWRCWYHQAWIPNTTAAKTGLPSILYLRGVDYVLAQWIAFVTPLLLIPASFFIFTRKRIAVGIAVAAMAWAFPAYAIAAKGDFMVMGRFLIPGLAFQTILLAWMLHALAGRRRLLIGGMTLAGVVIAAVGALPAWNHHLVPQNLREKFHFRFNTGRYRTEYEQWIFQNTNALVWGQKGKALGVYAEQYLHDPHASLVMGAIGACSFFCDLFIYDKNGLVTPEVAHRPIDPKQMQDEDDWKSAGHDRGVNYMFFLDKEPDILRAGIIPDVGDRRALVFELNRWIGELRGRRPELQLHKRYIVEYYKLDMVDPSGHTEYLVLYRKIRPDEDWREAWSQLSMKHGPFRRGGEAPLLKVISST